MYMHVLSMDMKKTTHCLCIHAEPAGVVCRDCWRGSRGCLAVRGGFWSGGGVEGAFYVLLCSSETKPIWKWNVTKDRWMMHATSNLVEMNDFIISYDLFYYIIEKKSYMSNNLTPTSLILSYILVWPVCSVLSCLPASVRSGYQGCCLGKTETASPGNRANSVMKLHIQLYIHWIEQIQSDSHIHLNYGKWNTKTMPPCHCVSLVRTQILRILSQTLTHINTHLPYL